MKQKPTKAYAIVKRGRIIDWDAPDSGMAIMRMKHLAVSVNEDRGEVVPVLIMIVKKKKV